MLKERERGGRVGRGGGLVASRPALGSCRLLMYLGIFSFNGLTLFILVLEFLQTGLWGDFQATSF